MESLFIRILNMSYFASWVIVFVIIVRLFFRKAPKKYSYLLWIIPLFRLLCPISFKSIFSVLPNKTEPISSSIMYQQVPQTDAELSVVNRTANATLSTTVATKDYVEGANLMQTVLFVGTIIWVIGIAVLAVYSLISLFRVHRKLVGAVLLRDNIWIVDYIESPFVMGIIRPRIYLTSSLGEREQRYIILHEQTHLRRKDHIVKLISFLVLCIHWFNPLVWIAFILSSKDMEMSCDEVVIKMSNEDIRQEYSASLLSLATGKRIFAVTPLAFGEGNTGSRIKNVLKYKKPSFWISIAAIGVFIILGICLLSNPESDIQKNTEKVNVESVYELKNEYIGNASSDGAILQELQISNNLGSYTTELETDSEPYVLRLCFEKEPADTDTFDSKMLEYSYLILALIDNADEVQWQYPVGDTLHTGYCSMEVAKSNLGVDVKKYGTSLPKFEKLCSLVFASNLSLTETINEELDGSIGGPLVKYTEKKDRDGNTYYVTDKNEIFQYKRIVGGRMPNSGVSGYYIILTNNLDITYGDISKSYYSNDSGDWLTDTVVIEMGVI